MDKEKKELAMRTAESFTKKSEIEKAFILGYMINRMQLKEMDGICDSEPKNSQKSLNQYGRTPEQVVRKITSGNQMSIFDLDDQNRRMG